jgi:hypothetical protein
MIDFSHQPATSTTMPSRISRLTSTIFAASVNEPGSSRGANDGLLNANFSAAAV